MRWFLLAAAAVVLSGCALPPVISVASLAFDVASYSATGKSVADHGLSMVLQRDCALLRGLEQGEVCVEPDSEFASKKPAREPETRGSRRIAFLQEENNRLMPRGMSAAEFALDSIAFVTDPDVAPRGFGPAGAGPLDELGYLSDGDLPQDEVVRRARPSGAAYLAQGMHGSHRAFARHAPDRAPGHTPDRASGS